MVSLQDAFVAVILIGLLLLVGRLLRERIPLFRKLYLPSSVLAGILALLLGPQVLGGLAERLLGAETGLAGGLFPQESLQTWRAIPGLLISVVFAALFLGQVIPRPREIWQKAGPQVAVGQILAWGQYAMGMLLALLVLAPLFGMNPMAGALIEIGFEGGHGTAAGLAATFEELGFREGADLALGLATIGIVTGIIVGTILVNWGARTGRLDVDGTETTDSAFQEQLRDREDRAFEDARPDDETQTTDPLSLQFGAVGLAIAIGWLLQQGLILVESVTWARGDGPALFPHVPLFPLAMLGGVILQLMLNAVGHGKSIDRRLMRRISGASLDFIIVAALATLSLTVLGDHLVPFLLLALTGIGWNLFVFLYLVPRIIPKHWFERGLGDFGQSMGVTVTGLLLIRMSDPNNRSGAAESFGYKQLLTEPFVGGGLITAASLPLIAHFGPVTFMLMAGAALLFWVGFGLFTFGPEARKP